MNSSPIAWNADLTRYRRRPTEAVRVGSLAVGGPYPIRVQSMTTPATTDTRATVEQIVRLVDAGCEIVRLTVPTSRDADNLPEIRRALARASIRVPLVADIHFTPAAAMRAVEHVEKIRINPGNYADKKKFAVREYTEQEYARELERIERSFVPLVRRCLELGVAMRIGTNHGSLSDRIMNRYGDTPEGMVESALEFVRVCQRHGYRQLILSMKASNPLVVLQAYRLLVERMNQEHMSYPLHLGVTEAGDGEDARIKSAIGIGALLDEGLGDTVRVSLTEDPVAEVPVARALVAPYNRLAAAAETFSTTPLEVHTRPSYRRRASREIAVGPRGIGGTRPVAVEVPLGLPLEDVAGLRRVIDAQVGVRVPEDTRAELVSVDARTAADIEAAWRLRQSLERVAPAVALSVRLRVDPGRLTLEQQRHALRAAHRLHLSVNDCSRWIPVIERLLCEAAEAGSALLVECSTAGINTRQAVDTAVEASRLAGEGLPLMLALDPTTVESPLRATRLLACRLAEQGIAVPLVLVDRPGEREADPLLAPSCAIGGLLCEGVGDSVHILAETAEQSRRLAFGILQASRVRITRTEFISCPSCGRTLFDLEQTTARIKAKTAHLKGVKIAVMGCIVNGPGEMADADFGYVGWGEDKIALFVGKDMVEKNVPTAQADRRLIDLIKQCGRWVDP